VETSASGTMPVVAPSTSGKPIQSVCDQSDVHVPATTRPSTTKSIFWALAVLFMAVKKQANIARTMLAPVGTLTEMVSAVVAVWAVVAMSSKAEPLGNLIGDSMLSTSVFTASRSPPVSRARVETATSSLVRLSR